MVGLRKNPPAKGTYFVPGGRVYKRENLQKAQKRIMMDELGVELTNVKFHGIYEHYYPNENPSGVNGIDIHYVVLVYEGELPDDFDHQQFSKQHESALWLKVADLLNHDQVHSITKAYWDDNFRPVFLIYMRHISSYK